MNDGYVFATNYLDVQLQLPFYGMVLLSLDDAPIHVSMDGNHIAHRAMALWARDVKFLTPPTRFVAIAVNPFHKFFRAFTKIGAAGVVALDRERFEVCRELMNCALSSVRFTHEQALRLHQRVLDISAGFLPTAPPLDQRAQHLMRLLCDDPRRTLSEMAEDLNLSYHRTSHLFTQAVGIPIRTYQLWQKLYRAGAPLLRGASLTEAAHAAGFVDSAHYSNAFQTAYGRSPREAFKTRRIVVFFRDAFTESAIGAAIRESGSAAMIAEPAIS